MPGPTDVLHALLGAMKELPPNRWIVSIDDVRKGPVLEHHVGVAGLDAWSRWKFTADGAAHDLKVIRTTAGETTITLDSANQPNASVDVHTTTHGISAVLIVKCHFTAGASVKEYRFDGRLWP
jgi:hypothetical protein